MDNKNLLGEERFYVFDKLPDNIKQIGEQPETGRIYVEDYVVTYMNRIFRGKADSSLVVFVGKRGEGAVQGNVFLYGAIEVEMDILSWKEQFTAQVWDKIHQQVHQYFSGGEVMGWGCGVHIGNSQVKKAVAGIQKKHFSRDGQVLFYWDYSEEEEYVCRWEQGGAQHVTGYMIYYGKNPQMQEYMLRGKKKESFEAGYQDTVMENVRTVIQNKEHIKKGRRPALYVAGGMLLVLTVLGVWLLMQSNKKIDSLESAIMTLSQIPMEEEPSEKSVNKTEATPSEDKKTTPAPTAAGDFAVLEKKSLDTAGQQGEAQASAAPASTAQGGMTTEKPAVSQAPEKKEPTVEGKGQQEGNHTQTNEKNKNNKNTSTKDGEKNSSTPKPASTSRVNSYVVQQGDTLSQIVWRQYHTTAYLERIKIANNIENEHEIQVGQRIILPLYEK